jgi:mannose-6-phosphate isomerase
MTKHAVLLHPFTQNYEWGKVGESSAVAQLLAAGYGVSIKPSLPYAELWMGDHPNGPCQIQANGEVVHISGFLRQTSMGNIEFLFKVLSVRKALSIQSHPDRALAEKLHASRPDLYKDANPKPELAIAISPFRALFGFRPLAEIDDFFNALPCLSRVLPLRPSVSGLRDAYLSLMRASPSDVQRTIAELLVTDNKDSDPKIVEAVALAKELNHQFPGGDVGVLSVFFLNIVELSPGECLFMGPNVPHAYLSGDILECMTSSDNVIRGGLTPKFKDVETLISSLDYTSTHPELLEPKDGSTWSPPNVPFAVSRICDQAAQIRTSSRGPSIALVMGGSGLIGNLPLRQGQSCLLYPGSEIAFVPDSAGFDVYLAFSPE